ncbi:MAG: hypothetical protein ACKVP0_24450 [Pirellulaceae bacterium]
MYEPSDLWLFLPLGYFLTVLLEMPVLLAGLSPQHSWKRKVLAGFWLTACTYPVVVLVMPFLIQKHLGQLIYLAIAETFAPTAECLLFWLAFYQGRRDSEQPLLTKATLLRDMLTIVAANLISFLVGGAALQFLWPQET